jgi:hypothetical protein
MPFPNVVRHRFFDIDVLARLTGHDGLQRVPMVRRRDVDRVDIVAIENLAEIGDTLPGKKTLGRYINKAKDQIDAASWRSGYRQGVDPNADVTNSPILKSKERLLTKRHKGISTAVNKLTSEESEQINEVGDTARGKAALNSYVIKSLVPSSEKSISNLASKGGFEHGERGDEDPSAGENHDAKSRNRSLGVLAAVRRLTKEETGLTEGANGMVAAKDNGSYPAHHDHITHDTYGDSGHEATGAQHKFAATHPPVHTFQHEGSTHKIFHHPNGSTIHTMEHTHGYHGDDIMVYSGHHDPKHIEKQEKKYGGMNESACMTDTSMGGADQIAQSKVGEIYKKPSKSVDAMNTTAVNKRVPAVESAVLDVMAKTFEKRKMFEDASNIAIISPEQRQDWLNVSTGSMEVVDYFNKYKV